MSMSNIIPARMLGEMVEAKRKEDESRANPEDVTARTADFKLLISLLYIRHGAFLTARNPSEERAVYWRALESAQREMEWRFVDRVPEKAALAEKALDEGRCQSCGTLCQVVVDTENNITYEPATDEDTELLSWIERANVSIEREQLTTVRATHIWRISAQENLSSPPTVTEWFSDTYDLRAALAAAYRGER